MHLLKLLGLTVGLLTVMTFPGEKVFAQSPFWIAQPATSEVRLQGTSWRLMLWGKPNGLKPPLLQTEITLQFIDGKFSGFSGCNQYNGGYTVTNNTLTMSQIGLTRKACSPEIMQQESQYINDLKQAESYAITDQGELRISYPTDDGTGVMVFAPQSVPGLW